jgi:hypothetical protein
MKIALLLLCLAPLVAAAQQNTLAACLESNKGIAELDPIRSKIMVAGLLRDTPFGMLTDTTLPTEVEKAAIAKWATIYAGCTRYDEPNRQTLVSDARALVEAYLRGTIGLSASLYSGELTYGKYNKERVERSQQLRVALASIQQREIGRNQAEEQVRLNTLLQILSLPRPVIQMPDYQPVRPSPAPVNLGFPRIPGHYPKHSLAFSN